MSISTSFLNQWNLTFIKSFRLLSLKKQWISLLSILKNAPKAFLILMIGVYRSIGTTHLGGCCRFEPSCSMYALHAAQTLPFIKALKLICVRILKCRPGGSFGYDPVPGVEGYKNARK